MTRLFAVTWRKLGGQSPGDRRFGPSPFKQNSKHIIPQMIVSMNKLCETKPRSSGGASLGRADGAGGRARAELGYGGRRWLLHGGVAPARPIVNRLPDMSPGDGPLPGHGCLPLPAQYRVMAFCRYQPAAR